MNHYFENLKESIKLYFHILSPEIPTFLEDYIATPPMQKQSQISVTCGTIYSKLCPYDWYSSLDHSVGVALIIWHFTQDKKQTLAGLFHDIATPAFKHTIDFLKGDYETIYAKLKTDFHRYIRKGKQNHLKQACCEHTGKYPEYQR